MPVEEDDLEKGQGTVATANAAVINANPELVWDHFRTPLSLETGFRMRRHFHYVDRYYWLPDDVMTAVYGTYMRDLTEINAVLSNLVVSNNLFVGFTFLLHLCLWTLVGVGVQYHWDTSIPGVMAVVVITSIGLIISTPGMVFAVLDCTDSIVFRTAFERLKGPVIARLNDAHAPLPPDGPIVAWKWELEGDPAIIPRKENDILKSAVQELMVSTLYLKLSWATRPATTISTSEENRTAGVPLDALRVAESSEELLQCMNQFRDLYSSAEFIALPSSTQRQVISDMKAAAIIARSRVTSEVWTPAVVQAYAAALGAANAVVPPESTPATMTSL